MLLPLNAVAWGLIGEGAAGRFAGLALLVLSGLAAFFAAALLLRAIPFAQLRGMIRGG